MFRLVYWATAPDRQAPQHLLAEFAGRLVDRKVTFARALRAGEGGVASGGLTIVHYGKREISDELTDLSIAAGEYSRFAVDPRIPRDRFEEMYRIWVAASVCGEMAGTVLIARDGAAAAQPHNGRCSSSTGDPIAGMITIKVTDGVGVERIFPMHSPTISKIEVVAHGKTRRARLYYLRNLRGKAARLKRADRRTQTEVS